MPKFDSILGTIGRTPVVRIEKLAPPGANLYAKLEAFNPMGSVKDRLALGIIEDAERSGALSPGQTVIEATSGNTGIGLAMVCARKGYPLVVTMAENFSVERRRMMRFLGAKVVLTPAALKGSGMLAKAVELAEAHGWFLCRQFENEANANIHSQTTAREILADFAGERLDYWVTGFGTGGTLKGVARVLKAERPDTVVVVCEPDNSQVLGSGIPQQRAPDGSPAASHPMFRPHLMQGWGPDFIPKLAEDAVALELIDRIVPVNGADALRFARELARQEGIFTGISGGATFAGALEVIRTAPPGTTVLCMLPDTGERYLTTILFEDIPADMNAGEIEISRSTPGPASICHSPRRPWPQRPKARARPRMRRPSSRKSSAIHIARWSCLRWNGASSAGPCAGCSRTSASPTVQSISTRSLTRPATIPQVFVSGEHIGGCTEVVDAWREGRLQALMKKNHVTFEDNGDVDPRSFLPVWLQPR